MFITAPVYSKTCDTDASIYCKYLEKYDVYSKFIIDLVRTGAVRPGVISDDDINKAKLWNLDPNSKTSNAVTAQSVLGASDNSNRDRDSSTTVVDNVLLSQAIVSEPEVEGGLRVGLLQSVQGLVPVSAKQRKKKRKSTMAVKADVLKVLDDIRVQTAQLNLDRKKKKLADVHAIKERIAGEQLEISRIFREKQEVQLAISKQFEKGQEIKNEEAKKTAAIFQEIQQLRAEELRDRKTMRSEISGRISEKGKMEELARKENWRVDAEGVPETQSSVKTSSSYDSISASSSASQNKQRSARYGSGNSNYSNISRVSAEKIRDTAYEFGTLPVDLITAAMAYIELMRVRRSLKPGDGQYERLVNLTKFRATNMYDGSKTKPNTVYNFDCM